ncbi:MAG TPA: LptF/LptG family permease [Armatimonadota bacterium]|mgnify:CR=1 FL=1|nr:LptF/LptG family permease [Armatimonadota bacterium]
MLRLVYRYLASELIVPFFSWIIGLVLLLVGNFLFLLLKSAEGRPLPWDLTLRYLVFRVPFALVLCAPMAFLFAVALTINRFARDGELTGLRMGGMGPRRILLPFFAAGLLLSVIDFTIYDAVVPWANHVSDNAVRGILLQQAELKPSEDLVIKPPDGDVIFFAKDMDLAHDLLKGVVLCRLLPQSFPEFVVASQAELKDNVWHLSDGCMFQFDDEGYLRAGMVADRVTIDLKEVFAEYLEDRWNPEQMSVGQLSQRVHELKRGGRKASMEISEMHSKFAIPFACLAFTLLAGPLALRFGTGASAFTGLLMAAVVLFIYYLLLAWSKVLGPTGRMDPVLAAWMPNAVFAVLGAVALVRSR